MEEIMKQIGKQTNRFARETEKGLDVAVQIYFNNEYQEYEVHSWNPDPDVGHKSKRPNIYHTDDRDDAIETARFILKRGI
jgi:hypothetical protein